MKTGTKSILFGVHAFWLHPIFVAISWGRLFGFPWHPAIWFSFLLHDIGYFSLDQLDSPEGEHHVEAGARLLSKLFDYSANPRGAKHWYFFSLLHSRFYAKKLNLPISKLCIADKFSIAIIPRWLYLLLANLSGEIHQYRENKYGRDGRSYVTKGETQWEWLTSLQKYIRGWVKKHKDGKQES